jgi:hypothetical protein
MNHVSPSLRQTSTFGRSGIIGIRDQLAGKVKYDYRSQARSQGSGCRSPRNYGEEDRRDGHGFVRA